MAFLKPAYILLDTKIIDHIAFEGYKAAAKPIVEKFGGKYLNAAVKWMLPKEIYGPL